MHYYRREDEGPTLHVTAGCGGAFLHPAPIARSAMRPVSVEWPSAKVSATLLLQVPWKIALGRSGFLPHLAMLALFSPLVLASGVPMIGKPTAILTTAIAAAVLALIGGVRRRPSVAGLAIPVAVFIAGSSILTRLFLESTLAHLVSEGLAVWAAATCELAVAAYVGAFLFGAYLAFLTFFGFENTQAFTALDHPGFKHFVRLRVRADGSAIDGFCMGLVDPVREGEKPVLVDTFTWKSR
jgi:hypothetical protein